jgi:microcystin-dependent protein
VVTRSNSSNGEIFVHVQNGFEIDELHDVNITTPLAGQTLGYNGTNWGNFYGGVPTGAMMMWYTSSAPAGWQICDGSAAATSALAAVVGANVPNLTGRIPVGQKTATSVGTSTITIASPAVVTRSAHGLASGQLVYFTTSGALPTGLTANTRYYVRNATLNTFNLSTTPTGSIINTSGSQSGTHTLFSSDFADLGFGSGSVSHQLTISEMAAHAHGPQGTTRFNAGNTSVTRTRFAAGTSGGFAFQSGTQSDLLQISSTTTVGSDLPHNNLQPYLVINYIIKT